jgi:hypothetical protein
MRIQSWPCCIHEQIKKQIYEKQVESWILNCMKQNPGIKLELLSTALIFFFLHHAILMMIVKFGQKQEHIFPGNPFPSICPPVLYFRIEETTLSNYNQTKTDHLICL